MRPSDHSTARLIDAVADSHANLVLIRLAVWVVSVSVCRGNCPFADGNRNKFAVTVSPFDECGVDIG